jgi:hypothetical protein
METADMNSPATFDDPSTADSLAIRVYAALQSDELGKRLALADPDTAAQIISTELAAINPAIRLTGIGERARGPLRELIVEWAIKGRAHEEVVVLPMPT